MADLLRALLVLADVVLASGVAASAAVHLRERRAVGAVIARAGKGRAVRGAGVAVLLAGAAAAVAGRGEIELVWTLPPLALALFVVLSMPCEAERVLGKGGLRAGFRVRRFEELEEWRLTGDHLRFRLRGRWEAMPLAAAQKQPVAERLRALAPERESPYR